jgi:hypothetical protein
VVTAPAENFASNTPKLKKRVKREKKSVTYMHGQTQEDDETIT